MRAGLPPSLPLEGAMIPNPLTAVTSTPEGSDGSVQDQRPTLLPPLKREVSTRAGQTASLTCRVQNLGYRQLMWIRARDLHVLSSGSEIFSTDSRVSVLERDGAWTLTIRYAQPRDGGKYACQVNTQPPIAEWFNLTVVEARAVITGKERIYVQSGSNISLTCTVREQLVVPGLVLWYHDEALVARDSSRVSVATTIDEVTTSVLTISSAAYPDSGNYSCWPSGGTPDSIQLLVIRERIKIDAQNYERKILEPVLQNLGKTMLLEAQILFNKMVLLLIPLTGLTVCFSDFKTMKEWLPPT
ncbi:Immunoglobulin I-set [Trinorchestia longiramus]|nr:Immunoglobulin I-set [Trinorchestia longiramus]